MATKLFSKGMYMYIYSVFQQDSHLIHSIFKGLAVYEKMEDKVKMKLESKIFTITMIHNSV